MMRVVEAAIVTLALGGTGGAPPPSSNGLIGRWGGDHVALTITAQDARMTLDCGTGFFPMPVAMDRRGGFGAEGTLELHSPGPTRADEQVAAPKAHYQGRLDGDRLALDVITTAPVSRRQYLLTRNSRVKLVRCL